MNSSCFCNGNSGGHVDVFLCSSCDSFWHQPAQRWTDRIARIACPYCGEILPAFSALHGGVTCHPYSLHPLQADLERFLGPLEEAQG